MLKWPLLISITETFTKLELVRSFTLKWPLLISITETFYEFLFVIRALVEVAASDFDH